MTTNLIETMAKGICCQGRCCLQEHRKAQSGYGVCDAYAYTDDARAALSALQEAGYDLVLRQHRDMGPGFTHHDGADCPCFAAPKVE